MSFVSKKNLYLSLVSVFLFAQSAVCANTVEQLKTFATTIVTAGLGEIVPPPVSIANDLVTNSAELFKANYGAHVKKCLTDLQSTYDEDKLKGTPLKVFKHKKDKLQALHSTLYTKDQTAIKRVIEDGKRLEKEIKDAIEKRRKKQLEDKKKRAQQEKETDNYVFQSYVESYQRKVSELVERTKKQARCFEQIKSRPDDDLDRNYLKYEIPKWLRNSIDKQQKHCRTINEFKAKMEMDLAGVQVAERLVNETIALAQARTKSCKTEEDENFIQQQYQVALNYFAQLEESYRLMQLHRRNTDFIIQLLDGDKDNFERSWAKREELEQRLLNSIKARSECIPVITDNVLEHAYQLKKEINTLITNYPDQDTSVFNPLINDLNAIGIFYILPSNEEKAEISRIYEEDRNWSYENINMTRKAEFQFNCTNIKDMDKWLKAAQEIQFLALLAVKSNESLSTYQCPDSHVNNTNSKKNDTVNNKEDKDKKDEQANSTSLNNNSVDDRTQSVINDEFYGGLQIAGPNKINVGESVVLTAVDAGKQSYSQGAFSWFSTQEDILTVTSSGNPVTARASEPGTAMVLVNYMDPDIGKLQAWLDIVITDEDDNEFQISGEVVETDVSDEFSIDGPVEISNEVSTTSVGDLCYQNYQQAVSALTTNIQQVEYLINVSKGCDWTSSMQHQLAAIKLCQQIQSGFQSAVNNSDAKAIAGLQLQANQNNCQISSHLWNQGTEVINAYNKAIDDRAAAMQEQQSRSEADAADVLSFIYQGIKSVQAGNKPSRSSNNSNSGNVTNNSTVNRNDNECAFCGTYEFYKTITKMNKEDHRKIGHKLSMRISLVRLDPSSITIRINNAVSFNKPYPTTGSFTTSFAKDESFGSIYQRNFYNFTFTTNTVRGTHKFQSLKNGKLNTEITYSFNATKL